MREFTGIKIVDLDVTRTRRSSRNSGLYHMYLRLSALPPPEWQQIFAGERATPRHEQWRHAAADGSFIVIECLPDELAEVHLRDLKQDVESSNVKYRVHLQKVQEEQELQERAASEERARLEELRSRLRFDA